MNAAELIQQFGYLGIVLLLILGGLGVPIPEEAPIILSAILSRKEVMWWPLAFAACLIGVLLGDFVVYFLGYFYGEKVLSFKLTRQFLTRPREAQIKGYFHRHGLKILIVGRFAVGFRTAAYLTAGILRLPPLRLLMADLLAATLSTTLMFAGGYWFADWIEAGLREMKHYIVLVVALAVAAFLIYRYVKNIRRAGRPVGPPVLVSHDDLPLPPDDLSTLAQREQSTPAASPPATAPTTTTPAATTAPEPPSPPHHHRPLRLHPWSIPARPPRPPPSPPRASHAPSPPANPDHSPPVSSPSSRPGARKSPAPPEGAGHSQGERRSLVIYGPRDLRLSPVLREYEKERLHSPRQTACLSERFLQQFSKLKSVNALRRLSQRCPRNRLARAPFPAAHFFAIPVAALCNKIDHSSAHSPDRAS